MYDCLKELIGLRGVCDQPTSNYYINDLPGIRFLKFSSTATEEDLTGKKLFERLHREAALQVAEDFLTKMSEFIQFNTAVDIEIIGRFENRHKEFYPRRECFVGREIYLNTTDPFMGMAVDYIEIKSRDYATKTIIVEDHYKRREVKAHIKPGINKIPIDYRGDYVRIYLNTCDIHLYEKDGCSCYMDDRGCSECSCHCVTVRNIEMCKTPNSDELYCVSGWEYTSMMPFRVQVRCLCDKERFVCQYRDELAIPIRWKIAALLMEETIYSDRRNPLVRNSKEDAERYYAKIMGGEDPITGFKYKYADYWMSLDQAIKRVKRTIGHSRCMSCSGLRIEDALI